MALKGLCVVTLVLQTTSLISAQREPTTNNGTTPDIEKVFKGRCWDYKETRYNGVLPRVPTSCDSLWDKFKDGFSYKPPCSISMDNYIPFINAGRQELPRNKVMFWSGVYQSVHRAGNEGRKFITLEDTLVGYLANGLRWCGQVNDPGIAYDYCPDWDDCDKPTTQTGKTFWVAAAKTYAQMASGEVTVLLEGSNPKRRAYNNTSIFGQYEIPNLSSNVTRMKILVSHTPGKPVIETCNTGSLLELKDDLNKIGLPYECQDDPRDVLHILCSDDPHVEECRLAISHAKSWQKSVSGVIALTLMTALTKCLA